MAKKKTHIGFLPLAMALMAIVSLLLLAYGYLQSSVIGRVEHAEQLEINGQLDEALEEYKSLAGYLNGFSLLKANFSNPYSKAMTGQLRVLYQLGQYDEAVEFGDICIQEEVDDMAAAYFWSGNAFLRRGINEDAAEDRFAWFNRAQDQYRKALERDMADRWNIRYNYELIRTVLEEAAGSEDDEPVKILRPKEQIQQGDPRIIG